MCVFLLPCSLGGCSAVSVSRLWGFFFPCLWDVVCFVFWISIPFEMFKYRSLDTGRAVTSVGWCPTTSWWRGFAEASLQLLCGPQSWGLVWVFVWLGPVIISECLSFMLLSRLNSRWNFWHHMFSLFFFFLTDCITLKPQELSGKNTEVKLNSSFFNLEFYR